MKVNWKTVKIGDVCIVERGGSPRPIDQYITDDPNGVNWIKIGDTSDSMFITSTAQKIRRERIKKSRYVKPGDFLLSNSMSFGRPYILKIYGCIHDGWLLLRDVNNLFDKRFLYYYLSAPSTYRKFQNMAVGGVVNNLNSDMVRNVKVPIPSINEQQDVADVLDTISIVIDNRIKQLQKLDELVKARFVEMFGDPESNPFGWEKRLLSEIIVTANNGMARRGNDTDGSIVMRLVELQDGFIDYSAPNRITLTEAEKARYRLIDNDFLFARVNGNPENVGRCAVFHEIGEPVYHNDHIIRVHFNEAMLDGVFASALINSVYGKRQIKSQIKTSAGQYTISQDGIGAITAIVPPIQMQKQFAAFVFQVNKSKLSIQASLDQLETLKQSLMQKYFG